MNPKVEKAIEKKKFSQLAKLAEGRDATLRLEAIEGMGKVPGEESFNYLTNLIRSPDAKVRGAAASALGELKDAKARAFLDHQMQHEEDPAVLEQIRGALARLREEHSA